VLKAFGDNVTDFNLPENSEWAAEIIKEGFTLEFMKNAIIRPVLSLRNKDLLLEWFNKVSSGNPDEPPPPEGEIFKSETYSNFIYLFFKIGTEVNVFSHLGKILFTQMKEAMFSDFDPDKDSDSEDEDDILKGIVDKDTPKTMTSSAPNNTENSAAEENVTSETVLNEDESQENGVNGDENQSEEMSEADKLKAEAAKLLESLSKATEALKVVQELKKSADNNNEVGETLNKCKEQLTEMYNICPDIFPQLKPEPPKTVTSMYGKVYNLKR